MRWGENRRRSYRQVWGCRNCGHAVPTGPNKGSTKCIARHWKHFTGPVRQQQGLVKSASSFSIVFAQCTCLRLIPDKHQIILLVKRTSDTCPIWTAQNCNVSIVASYSGPLRDHDFVGSFWMQVETKSKRNQIPSVLRPKPSSLGMYLFRTVGRIVYFDTVQYSTRLLCST